MNFYILIAQYPQLAMAEPKKNTSKTRLFLLIIVFVGLSLFSYGQNTNDTSQNLTLEQCIDYALHHQPLLQRSLVYESIARTNNAINLAGWLPQVSASGNLIHNLQHSNSSTNTSTQSSAGSSSTGSGGRFVNTFIPGVTANQTLFNPTLVYALKSAPLYVKQAQQVTDSTKINIVSSVSKSFYNLLQTLQQINVLKEDTARLGKNVQDTYHQYVGGIVDETDYEEATITLNNSKAQLKQATENISPQYAMLKQSMGYPPEKQFNVSFDTLQMMKSIAIDTTQQLQYEKRIEYQAIRTQKDIQDQAINYYRFSFLPTVSAFFNYNLAFENNNYNNLLSNSYPSSLIGLSFNIPIFTGFARLNNLKKAKLEQQVNNWNEINLKSNIYTEYKTALANYKGNLYNMELLQKNETMAKRVYFVVTLQYKQGIVPYLNVITAESNLITSEINYTNALFQVLSSKIDLQKAMGNITY